MKNEEITQEWENFKEEYAEYVLGGEKLWRFTFEKVKKFINENKNRPNEKSKNPEEKKLGAWLSTQNTNYKNNTYIMKNEEITQEWEDFKEEYAEYILYGEELWIFTLKKVKKFIDENKNRPNKRSTNPEEKKLGAWLSTQNTNYKNNTNIMKNNKEIKKEWEDFKEEYL